MSDSLKLLKITSVKEDWCPKDERKLELRLGPPGDELNSFTAKSASPSVCHKRTAPAPVIGWPPIRSFRKNISHGNSAKTTTETLPDHIKQDMPTFKNPKNGSFVKINMDGVPIGRKIDLAAYTSYEKLSGAIDNLFRDLIAAQRNCLEDQTKEEEIPAVGKPLSSNNEREEYTLVYEDNEGDTILVGDVPWHMFVAAATRLRVMQTSEIRTLSFDSIKYKNKPVRGNM